MASKSKLKRFKENKSFGNLLQPTRNTIISGEFKNKHNQFFKSKNPIIIELGCGKGEYTIGLAKLNIKKNCIGIDVKGARIWRGAKTATEEKIENVLFIRTQIELIEHVFDKNEVDQIWLTFPDPQIKYKRTKHRLINTSYLEKYRKILKPDGTIHLKTDSEFLHGYTLGILENLNIIPCLVVHDIYKKNNAPNEVLEIKTHYEKMFIKEGKSISYIKFKL